MSSHQTGPERKMVWRISKEAPQGGWVVPSTTHPELVAAAKEVASGSSWASSSFDLLHGAQVTEDDPTTISAEPYDELFNNGNTTVTESESSPKTGLGST